MAMRRGFKAEANSTADEIRGELGLGFADPLDPADLAAHLAIPLVPLSEFVYDFPNINHLLEIEPSAFSAITIFRGNHRLIVHNDAHSAGRRNSNITHELSHGLLLHQPRPALDHRGCRHWDQAIEDEADWLTGALLVPERAALTVARGRRSLEEAAEHFGVSERMMRWRLNITGAYKRAARGRGRSAG